MAMTTKIGRLSVGAAAALTSWLVPVGPSSSQPTPTLQVIVRSPRAPLAGVVRLRAQASSRTGRIIAVTFRLDGRALGTDTTRPYSIEFDASSVAPGEHALDADVVDSLGRRRSSPTTTVRTRASAAAGIAAAPGRGLRRALAKLAAGHSVVRLAPGRYTIPETVLASGATLLGSGPSTVLVPDSRSYFAVLSVHGSGITIADLTIDGEGPGAGKGIGVAVRSGSSHVLLQRLKLVRVRGDGVNMWGSHADVSLQDSAIDGDGTAHAGVVALESASSHDTSVIRTRIRGFRSFGILFAQKEFGRSTAGQHALALDDEISDVVDPARAICRTEPLAQGCGTNEAGIQTGAVGAALVGNVIERTGWDGIETVGASTNVAVLENDVRETRTGIYLEHATNRSLFARNMVSSVRTGINIEYRYAGVGSSHNVFLHNRIVGARRSGLFADLGGDSNRIMGNVFVGGARPSIVLKGSSANVIRDNLSCAAAGRLVEQRPAWRADGTIVRPRGSVIADNTTADTCPRS